jgi:acetyl-CoA synthetase
MLLEKQRVSVWYTAPTAIRRLMRVGEAAAAGHDLSALRVVATVGERLKPEAVLWGQRALHRTIQDTWWQTETGSIAIADYRLAKVKRAPWATRCPDSRRLIVRLDVRTGNDRRVSTTPN